MSRKPIELKRSCPTNEQLAGYICKRLPREEVESIAQHLLRCERCFAVHTEEQQELRARAVRFWRKAGLSGRASNALSRAGVTSWAKLISMTERDLLSKQGIGKGTAREIVKLAAHHANAAENRRDDGTTTTRRLKRGEG